MLLAAGASLRCGSEPEPEPEPWVDTREPCSERDPMRNVYFGDLHVHTANSFDAYLSDVRVDPAQAYRFARGETITIPGGAGGTQQVTIDRPLDFAAVTDHAEYLGEVSACTTPGAPGYESDTCVGFRANSPSIFVGFGTALSFEEPQRREDVCGPDGADCLAAARDVWSRVQGAAEDAYDRSAACSFTSFVAYEWSAATALSNLHRNVIFRSSQVPPLPVSSFEATSAEALWASLWDECVQGINGCDVLAIPHNSNWSNGRLFNPEYAATDGDRQQAERQARLEPLVEIFQHKGDSECENGVSGILGEPDELCGFEKLVQPPFMDCGDGVGSQGMTGAGCLSRRDFLRGALLTGLEVERDIGVNPLRLGVIASTDTHNGTPGQVAEDSYPGHFGSREGGPLERLTAVVPGGVRNSPGGLVAVWAEENTREALFDAMRRRETYGTSGPRIAVRMFGGWELPEDMCAREDLVELGYERGVPMGGELPPRTGSSGPAFVVSALRDPEGAPLQRAQIIKGWLDASGQRHVEVHDVAGGDSDASVDPASCAPQGAGADSLCGLWRDPAFDPAQPAFYYARIVENPTCRWSARDCLTLAETLPPEELPAVCEDPTIPKTIQERAWTSPIWL
ncbi:MAG: DUF3604 domain-containing protein [Myxococcales bacterium]|nr:DUF3604 domain-containing protein [Myxococcales bacterium]